MGLHIEIDGIRDADAKVLLENTIRDCIGDPPKGEDWDITVDHRDSQNVVVVRTPRQAARKIFFSNIWNLVEEIPEWLQQHPVQ